MRAIISGLRKQIGRPQRARGVLFEDDLFRVGELVCYTDVETDCQMAGTYDIMEFVWHRWSRELAYERERTTELLTRGAGGMSTGPSV
jgi:hypothetical protein